MENLSAKELRIGNWIRHKYSEPNFIVSVINTFNENTVNGIELDDCEPIPLTKQWLVDFEFEGQISDFYKNKLTITLKDSDKSHLKGRVYFNSWAILEKQPEYVHELQNLYFALTGEELELKTKTL